MMKIEKGDRVKHWFAGTGTVQRVEGKTRQGTAWVKWDRGRSGGAKKSDLTVIKKHNP